MAKDDSNNNFYVGVLFVFIAGCLWLIWHLFGREITMGVRWIRVGELHIISLFTSKFDGVMQVLPTLAVGPQAKEYGPGYLGWETLWNVSVSVGKVMRIPTALVLFYCIWWVIRRSPRTKFKHKYDLEGIIKLQSTMWPVITPIVNFNPATASARVPGDAVPTNLPMFAEALSPDEWLAWCGVPVSSEGIPDKEGIRQSLIDQLGPRWQGLTGLKPYHRALFAAFALKGNQKRKESEELLGMVSQCWSEKGGLQLTEGAIKIIEGVIADKKIIEPAMKIASNHAFRTTALVGVLRWAREQGGVLAPSQFLWLRAEDRGLWYPLNNLGRRSYHAEAAGAMAHFMAERYATRALPMPRVDTAIQPFLDYLKSNGSFIPDVVNSKKA